MNRRIDSAHDAADVLVFAVDARTALDHASLSRRRFLRDSGLMIVGISLSGVVGGANLGAELEAAQRLDGAGSDALDAWLAIAEDGRVTGYTGKCEFGQGLYTAQTQLIAEELAVPFSSVTLVQCDTARTPDQGTTSGSQSHPTNFNQRGLAQAAATAREALIELGAAHLGVPVDQLAAADGRVTTVTSPARSVSYAGLLGGRTFNLRVNPNASRRAPGTWTVLGTSVPRVEIPALVTGRFEFVHNVRVPGMLHGCVVRPPRLGATLGKVDESSVRDIPGFVKVIVRKNFVGVVAEKPWQALQAAGRLNATWTGGTPLPRHGDLYEHLRRQRSTRDVMVVDSADVDRILERAATVVGATYWHPYQAHASLGSSCAVADVQGETATIWSATQSLYAQQATAAELLGRSPANVRVIYRMGSGCYGLNGADTVSYDAALMSQAVGKPVRVQLTRRDELGWENYGLPYVIDQRVAVDAQGAIVAWDYESWSMERGGRPANASPPTAGNVITGLLAGFEPAPFVPRSPAPPPTGVLRNTRNDVPSYLAGCIDGVCGGTGTVRSGRVLSHTGASPFFTGPLRSPNRLQNTFAHESLLDEVAARVKADPIAYRLRHLADPRLIEVVRRAAQAATWDPRPSPGPGRRTSGVSTGRGASCVLYEGDNGYGALVAEVEVDQQSGAVRVTRFVVAQDCGPISNPDGLKGQTEGGLLQGMSRALGEEVTWNDEAITSIDWRTYHSLSLGSDMPTIESVLINRTEGKAMGAGETSITLVAAAMGNAIFDATGARVRQVPFTPDRVKAALAARSE